MRDFRMILSSLKKDLERSSFSIYHILKTLDLVEREGALGRILLSKYLRIGEGSARNILKRLKDNNLITIDPVAGGVLTEEGREFIERWRRYITSICVEKTDLVSWRFVVINILSDDLAEKMIKRYGVVNLRDEIVKKGCSGCILLKIHEGRPMLLNARGEPDYDISSTDLGRKMAEICREYCIATGSEESCQKAEACAWDLVVEILIRD